MKKIGILALLSAMSINVNAIGLANHFGVDFVRVDKDGRGYVKFTSDLIDSPPACTQANYTKALAFNASSEGGKAVLSLVLTAKAAGKKIYAKGTGTCTVYGVMEDWNWGYVK